MTTASIKELRDATGVSIMQCKRALEEAGGDFDKAVVLLRKASKGVAEKKASRELKAGVVQAYVHGTRGIGAMVLLSCETDFVAKNQEFVSLAYDIAMHVAAANPAFLSLGDVPEATKTTARAAFAPEVEGKPEGLRESILAGKLEAYFRGQTLLEQPFIKNPDLTIRELVDSATQKFGEKIEVTRFVRFNV